MNFFEEEVSKEIIKNSESVSSIKNNLGCAEADVCVELDNLKKLGYIDASRKMTDKLKHSLCDNSSKNAIILAAGIGMRMVPINTKMPKGLLTVRGERIIETTIKHLHSIGVDDITVVTGFMSESFEYLEDKYGVKNVFNPEYFEKNNLHSLAMVADKIRNTYIIPSDIWCQKNPFSSIEMGSWYMVSNIDGKKSMVCDSELSELVEVDDIVGDNSMIGISYITGSEAVLLRERLMQMDVDKGFNEAFWETALFTKEKMRILPKVVSASDFVEINTYEQLRELDESSISLRSNAINIISDALKVSVDEIRDICVLKKGMTNRSFVFECQNKKYIMRIPGEGTDQLIDRKQEADVYKVIANRNVCDEIIYMNSENGYKISEFISGARNCNPYSKKDVLECMRKLRFFHELELAVNHKFDIFEQIEYYELLRDGTPSIYSDYEQTKKRVFSLSEYINQHKSKEVLTHIDAVPDNFIFTKDKDGNTEIRLIDWEYSGMQDPHVDIAMFCIYSMYNKPQVDSLIDAYFIEGCSDEIRTKIYCYISACGLLWSNWCEYKRCLGVEFGDYAKKQYNYAKTYYKHVHSKLNRKV